jgi:hypothetical protein
MVMIQPISELSVEVIPQAIIDRPVSEVVGKYADVLEDTDELGTFEGASFKLDGKYEIAVRRYPGYPKDKAKVYIDQKVKSVPDITAVIRAVLKEFGLTADALKWERSQDPQL